MIDPYTYRTNERLAKSLLPSWRLAQIHNLDHFERAGFPVRIETFRELAQLIDTMQENRLDAYMRELGGLTAAEFEVIAKACADVVVFQALYLPNRKPILPLSTMIACYALYHKVKGAAPQFKSVLEIGPGTGYLPFFIKHHSGLANYSQIEACESFYILQNMVNHYCFGLRSEERAFLPLDVPALDWFANARADTELSNAVRLPKRESRCVHYPWWRIGELITEERTFDVVMSNANLLEFSPSALDDYSSVVHSCLNPGGVFLAQCIGSQVSGTAEQLMEHLYRKGFARLMFVRENQPVAGPRVGGATVLDSINDTGRESVIFSTTNALFVKKGHPLHSKYYTRDNLSSVFVAPEELVFSTFFRRAPERRSYGPLDFLEATESELGRRLLD